MNRRARVSYATFSARACLLRILTWKKQSRYIMARGERSEDVWAWYTAVYEAIQEIPYGRVTSYGHIARLVGKRTHASLLNQTSSLDLLT